MKNMYEIMNIAMSEYNRADSPELESIIKAHTTHFSPSTGGTPAMMIRMHPTFVNDDQVSIYRSPYGVIKSQQFFGYMCDQTKDIKF